MRDTLGSSNRGGRDEGPDLETLASSKHCVGFMSSVGFGACL